MAVAATAATARVRRRSAAIPVSADPFVNRSASERPVDPTVAESFAAHAHSDRPAACLANALMRLNARQILSPSKRVRAKRRTTPASSHASPDTTLTAIATGPFQVNATVISALVLMTYPSMRNRAIRSRGRRKAVVVIRPRMVALSPAKRAFTQTATAIVPCRATAVVTSVSRRISWTIVRTTCVWVRSSRAGTVGCPASRFGMTITLKRSGLETRAKSD